MKSFTCPSCGATLSDDLNEKILTCEYCGQKVVNEYYEEADVEDAADEENEEDVIYLDDVCIEYLTDMYEEQNVDLFSVETGTPIKGGKIGAARENFEIPEEDEVYFIYDSTILGGCQRGFALCTSGVYYRDDDLTTGSYTWEEFIDNEISYEDGEMCIHETRFVTGDPGEEMADFLIDFHDRVFDYWYEEDEEE